MAAGVVDKWWANAVFYQVYPRSFADTTGSGVGDLPGITAHLDYLQTLGVDALWLSPFYPSGGIDAGYDVVDYCGVDPLFGTLDDFDALLTAAHGRGMRIIIDLVPNHSSDQHPLFVEALKGGPARALYHFEDGHPSGEGPPNNWQSVFGGSSWTQVPDGSGQWYYHLFAPEQPDFNWENPQVLDYFEGVLRFWLDRGVDGFRIDVSDALIKDRSWPDTPDGSPVIPKDAGSSIHEIYRQFRKVLDEYPGAMSVLETGADEDTVALFLRPDEMHQAFNFRFLKSPWDAGEIAQGIRESLAAADGVGAPSTWVIENHDTTRAVTRYGSGESLVGEYVPIVKGSEKTEPTSAPADTTLLGYQRSRAMALLLLSLPGSAYIYQGQELGLPEVLDLPDQLRADPGFLRSGGQVLGRDGCRVPLPWSGIKPPFGFVQTWLPQPADWVDLTAEVQASDPDSMLSLYRTMLELRRSEGVLGAGKLSWVLTPEQSATQQVLHIRLHPTSTSPMPSFSAAVDVLVNFGDAPLCLPEGKVLIASSPVEGGFLPASAAVVLGESYR